MDSNNSRQNGYIRYRVPAGKKIYSKGSKINEIGIILKGRIAAKGDFGTLNLSVSNVIGIADITNGTYIFDYIAKEECEIFAYNMDENNDTEKAIQANNKFASLMVATATKFSVLMSSVYDDLSEQCSEIFDTLTEHREQYLNYAKKFAIVTTDIEDAVIMPLQYDNNIITMEQMDFSKSLSEIPQEAQKAFFSSASFVTYYITMRISELIVALNEAIGVMYSYIYKNKDFLIGEEKKDIFYAYSQLAFETAQKGIDVSGINRNIEKISQVIENISIIDKSVLETAKKNHKERLSFIKSDENIFEDDEEFKLRLSYSEDEIKEARNCIENSAVKILDYSELAKEEKERFLTLLYSYEKLKDKASSESEAVLLRKQITELFYIVYEKVFLRFLKEKKSNPIIDMFLNFGYMDDKLLTDSQSVDLYFMSKNKSSGNVIYFKDWLTMIYEGKVEPSRNEFDIDYQEYLREMKRSAYVSPEQEKKYLEDQHGKVVYEIRNMFKATNKMTFGRISSFCPVLSSYSINGDLQKAYVVSERINSILNDILKIDYSLFYRECIYRNEAVESINERVMKNVMPYFILTPNFGSRCIMWQDIEGRKKDSPARFLLSVFTLEDLSESILLTMGRYRWEICKTIQGIRWTDIETKSLTSEYYDYLQFYKKNREISEKGREKIKLMLQKKANNYKEVFTNDYVEWIKYESRGAARLNSYTRRIMMDYCPFPGELRAILAENPLFTSIIRRFESSKEAKLKRLSNLKTTILKNKGVIDEDFENNIKFYEL